MIRSTKILALLVCLLFCCHYALAQKNHFIYIQTDNKQPFYVKLEKKVFSSSITGYVIIPKLVNGEYNFILGFPKNEWPEQKITFRVENEDAGYLFKNFGDKGWGFYNLQTMQVAMANQPEVKEIAQTENPLPEKKDTPEPILEKPAPAKVEEIKKPAPQPTPVADTLVKSAETIVPIEKKEEVVVPEGGIQKGEQKIERAFFENNTEGTKIIYRLISKNSEEHVTIFIPVEKEITPEAKKTDEPIATDKKFLDLEINAADSIATKPKKEDAPQVTEESKKLEEVSKPETKAAITQPEPAQAPKRVDAESQPPPAQQTPVTIQEDTLKKSLVIPNSNCREFATEDDFIKLRRKMVAEDNDDDMVSAARKIFKATCFNTTQIRNLSTLFLTDEGKYKFFDAVYAYTSDSENYPTLLPELKDNYYINRFKSMIRQ